MGLLVIFGVIGAVIVGLGLTIYYLYIWGLYHAILFIEGPDCWKEDWRNVAKCIGWHAYLLPLIVVGWILKRDLYEECVDALYGALEENES